LKEKPTSYFIDAAKAPRIIQMKGLETTILTGLPGEKMMMVLNVTLSKQCAVAFASA